MEGIGPIDGRGDDSSKKYDSVSSLETFAFFLGELDRERAFVRIISVASALGMTKNSE